MRKTYVIQDENQKGFRLDCAKWKFIYIYIGSKRLQSEYQSRKQIDFLKVTCIFTMGLRYVNKF